MEEACEIVTRSDRILKEKEVEKNEKEKESVEEESEQEAKHETEKNMLHKDQAKKTVKAKDKDYEKPLPYPKIYSRKEREKQFERFMELFKKLEITIPFFEALQQIPSYAKFLKELITKKRKHLEEETIEVQGNCSAVLQRSLPPKLQDPGSFLVLLEN